MSFWRKKSGAGQQPKTDIPPTKPPPLPANPDPQPPSIYQAAGDGDLEKVKALLKANPDLAFTKNNNGSTPLTWAAMYGRKDVVEFFLGGIPPDGGTRDYGVNEALQAAASKAVAELLVRHKADVNWKNKGGWTPLLSAAMSGRTEVVELLVAHQAEVNVRNADGWTPLHLAAYYNYFDAVKLLLAGGAEVNATGNDGQTPLHAALYYKGSKELAALLLAHKAEVNVKDKNGKTPLHFAASERKKDFVELLLANKAEVNPLDNRGKTPLQLALIAGHKDTAELLHQYGGNESPKTSIITEVTLPAELIQAAMSLEERLRRLEVPTRKVPLDEWNQVPHEIQDLIPNWMPTLLAHFSLHGGLLECKNNYESRTWPRYFSLWGPAEYTYHLYGGSRYCFADEFVADGLVMISDESNGDMWLTSILGGPSSPIYLFDLSGHENIFACSRIALLLSAMNVSSENGDSPDKSSKSKAVMWRRET